MREAPPGWLHGDRLHRVWGLVGDALERRSLEARGTVELRDLSREERHALSDVVGAPITGEAVRLKLADLDARLRVRTGRELAAVVTWLTGRSLVDRADRRRLAAARREEPFEAARQWLSSRITSEADRPEAAMGGGAWVEGWVEGWVDGLRRDGVLTTVKDGGAVLVSALEVLDDRGAFALSEEQVPARLVVARTELAARHTGSAHGLDDGTKVALLVLRAAAARAATSLPRTATDRRRLWESLGVVVDRVSTTCLTWNLLGESARIHASEKDVVAGAARGPAPVHVTWWDLEAGLDLAPGQRVLVCENPRTLEAIAESCGSARLGVVCTMGRANLVVAEVLGRLVRSGGVLRYHGDFDWPGVALANACFRDYGARPWLMSADDYLTANGAHQLTGQTVEAAWDPELGAAMRSRGVAVHEEAVLDRLLERLAEIAG